MRSRPLADDEGEVVAEFEHEVFKMMHEGISQLGLRVFVLQAKEFEHERIFDFLVDRERVFKAGRLGGRTQPGAGADIAGKQDRYMVQGGFRKRPA